MTRTIRHGTYGGYQAHRILDEEPCDDCREASAAYHRKYRESPSVRRKMARENAARSRAVWRLAAEFPARFKELVAEELRS